MSFNVSQWFVAVAMICNKIILIGHAGQVSMTDIVSYSQFS